MVLDAAETGLRGFSSSAPIVIKAYNPTVMERIGEAAIGGLFTVVRRAKSRFEGHGKTTLLYFDDKGEAREAVLDSDQIAIGNLSRSACKGQDD